MKKIHPLRIIPLGGLGEIGKNMMVYQYGEEYLIVDAGLMFPENDMLGVDYLIPDFQFLRERRQKIRGIVITHGHEDHIGAIQHLLEDVQAMNTANARLVRTLHKSLRKQCETKLLLLSGRGRGEGKPS